MATPNLLRCVSGIAKWRNPDGTTLDVLSVTNGRMRLLVHPDDVPAIAETMLELLDARDDTGVKA